MSVAPMPLRRSGNSRPVPVPTPEHLALVSRSCPACGTPRPVLEYRGHPDQQPDWDLPDFGPGCSHLAGLISPGPTLCRRCKIDVETTRVVAGGRVDRNVSLGPEAAEIARLRALIEPPAPAPPDPDPTGSRFKLGRVAISPAAALAVGAGLAESYEAVTRGSDGALEHHARHASARSEFGRQAIMDDFLARHAKGDLGQHGKIASGDAAKARPNPSLASAADRAALAVADGLGTIHSSYLLPAGYPPRSGDAFSLFAWTELHPTAGPATLFYAGPDQVRLD